MPPGRRWHVCRVRGSVDHGAVPARQGPPCLGRVGDRAVGCPVPPRSRCESLDHTGGGRCRTAPPLRAGSARSRSGGSSGRRLRRPGEEDSYRAVTNRRTAARLPVASPCPRRNRGRWCHGGCFPATALDRHPGSRRVPTTATVAVPAIRMVP
jgi:hypothetical protein